MVMRVTPTNSATRAGQSDGPPSAPAPAQASAPTSETILARSTHSPRATVRLSDAARIFGRHVVLPKTTTSFVGGTSVALIGPNGSGKTTLLRLLAGLDDPTSGTVHRDCSSAPVAPPGRGPLGSDTGAPRVAYVAQDRAEHDWMPITAGEVVRMGRYAHRGLVAPLRKADRRAIELAMDEMSVSSLAHRTFTELSGGQQQRVLVARALAANPDILLMDEPITGLDEPTQEVILSLVDRLTQNGVLVVISTHHLDEASRCDRVLLVDHGIVADGSPASVLAAGSLAQVFRANQIDVHGDRISLFDEHGHGHDHDPNHGHEHTHSQGPQR